MGILRLGVIGWPLQHAASPHLWRHILRQAKADDRLQYEKYSIPPAGLQDFMLRFRRDPTWYALNVTIPYKERIISYLDALTPEAQAIGAVNAICKCDGEVWGHNTDAMGFERSVGRWWGWVKGRKALVFGTGGASRAVQYVLRKQGIPYVLISRNPSKGRWTYGDLMCAPRRLHPFGCLINATPAGMIGHSPLRIPLNGLLPTHYCFDLVYAPALTPFLKMGLAVGAAVMNGSRMLWEQALAAARWWRILDQ